jgi:replicative DNA helicase
MGSQKKELYQQKSKVESIFNMIEEGVAGELSDIAENTDVAYLKEFEEDALEYLKNDGKYMGVSTGYQGIDNLLGSFLPGELLTIGGDTGHGKSLLAMNIAQNAYTKLQEPVLMVNLELTRNQAVQRFYNLSGEDHDYAGILTQRAPAVSYRDIDVLMKKAKEEGCCLVVIDHLHFFSRSADNETRELSRITKHFKECAVENELPVILLSHVTPTRKMDDDGNVKKTIKPGLHNLKGSSSIEQDSDMVGFVYREDGESEMSFFLRKNRSRPLNTQSTYLIQTGWRLEEIPSFVPQNLQQSGESSQANLV